MSKVHHNNAKHQAAYKTKRETAGLVQVNVIIPEDRREDLKALAAAWRQQKQAFDL